MTPLSADLAVHDLLEPFRPELLRLATRICGATDSEDAVQVSLLRAAARISDFEGGTDAKLRAWLRTIVRNQCLAQIRSDRRRQRTLVGDQLESVPRAAADGTPSQAVRRREEAERLVALLSNLTPEQMEAISYRYLETWSIADIARQMNKSESAVTGLLTRGLARLRLETSPSEWSRILN